MLDGGPVHPSEEGYNRIVDFLETEFGKLSGGRGVKRSASIAEGPPRKKPRAVDRRARWVESTQDLVQRTGHAGQGERGGGGYGRPYRGRPYGGPYRGRPYRGRPFRGRFKPRY